MTVRTKGYDNIAVNHQQLLALLFAEGDTDVTHDISKSHYLLTLNDPGGGSFAWGNMASGFPYLQYIAVGGGAAQGVYLDCPAADTAALNFTTEDYSIGGWVNWSWNGYSSILIGRYGVNLDGWETYFDISGGRNTLSQRHHHVSLTPNENSNCYSEGWTPGEWHFLGISRSGASLYPVHYRNAVPLEMSYETTGMLDPDTCNRDLVLGCRYTKDANWYLGFMGLMRGWGDRALSQEDWEYIFETERHWFGA